MWYFKIYLFFIYYLILGYRNHNMRLQEWILRAILPLATTGGITVILLDQKLHFMDTYHKVTSQSSTCHTPSAALIKVYIYTVQMNPYFPTPFYFHCMHYFVCICHLHSPAPEGCAPLLNYAPLSSTF